MRPTLLLLLPLLATAPAQRYSVASGRHVDAVCWFTNVRHGDDLAATAVAVAEDARTAARSCLGRADAEVEEGAPRMVVNVYEKRRGVDGFVEAVDAIEAGASQGVVAWNHPPSLGIFVKLQPVANDFLMDELGFPPVSLHHLARQSALLELSLAAADPAGPRWLREGLATRIADGVLVARGRLLAGTRDPAVSTRIRSVRRLRDGAQLPGLEEWLAGETGELGPDDVHALDATVLRFVAERLGAEALAAFVGSALRGEHPAAFAAPALLAALGLDDAGELEVDWLTWLDELPAPWDDEYPSLSTWGEDGGWIQAAATPRFALCWNEPPPSKEYVIRAEVELFRDLSAGMCQLNFALGRLPGGEYVSLSFNSRNGVLAWDYSPEGDGEFTVMTPIALGTGPLPRRKYRITLHVAEGRVTPYIRDLEDEEAVPARLRPLSVEGRDMSGPWGIGTIRGGAVLWRSLTVEPYSTAERDDESDR